MKATQCLDPFQVCGFVCRVLYLVICAMSMYVADSDVSSGGGYSGRSVRSALSRTNTSMNTSSGDALSTADTPAPPAILQMMLQWTLAQMKLFIVVFSRQVGPYILCCVERLQ